jgi:MIP family channel proteins
LAISIAVSVFGGISGAHVNPAITIGMLATGRIKPPLAVGYLIAQLVGATVAAFICNAVFPPAVVDQMKLGIPLPGSGSEVSTPTILIVEAILTFLLMTSIYGTAVDERGMKVKIGGFAIGLTVTMDILAGGAITGASMNPARSFGPALVLGHFDLHWCYWVGPIIGSVVAAFVYNFVLLPDDSATK